MFLTVIKVPAQSFQMGLSDTFIAKKSDSIQSQRLNKTVIKSSKIDSLIKFATSLQGRHYRRGGTGKGFDCSGFTMVVFAKHGIRLPHTSAGQSLIGIPVLKQNLSKGDLIFFKGRNRRSKRIGHVGIVISSKGEEVQFIHSASGEGIRVDRLNAEYYRKRYVKGSRVINQR